MAMTDTGEDARRLAIREALHRSVGTGSGAAALPAAFLGLWQQTARQLEPVIGARGVDVLFGRALHLTARRFLWLPSTTHDNRTVSLEVLQTCLAGRSAAEVSDIRSEWEDRYGPVPAAAESLLAVGSLRAECNRLGLRDVQIVGQQARLGPLDLKFSEEMRLRRLSRDSIYKEDQQQVVVPFKRGIDPAVFLVAFLQQLIPPAE